MSGDFNVWECLGLDPPTQETTIEYELRIGPPVVDDSEDVDIFEALEGRLVPYKSPVVEEAKPTTTPKMARRFASFEARWKDEERYWKQREKEWKEKSQQSLFFDESLYCEDDPFDTGPYSVPHR